MVGRDARWEDEEGKDAWMMLLLRCGKAVLQVPRAGGYIGTSKLGTGHDFSCRGRWVPTPQ